MRSRFLAVAIVAALLLNLLGAEFAFARADNVPACCLRAAHPMHCHGMTTQPVAVESHLPASVGFTADYPLDCACPMGFAPGSAAVPLPSNTSIRAAVARSSRLASRRQVATTSSSIRIDGDRAPPQA